MGNLHGESSAVKCVFGSFQIFPNKQVKNLTLSEPLGRMPICQFAGGKSFILKMSQKIASPFTPGWDDKCMATTPLGYISK